MKKALTLSIVIPVYNEQDYLKACLDSIAAQSEMPDEVIVVDNNSTDKSVEVAKSYNFVKVIHETKQGVLYARNRGFDSAKSLVIGRIDGDTILPEGWVAYVKKFYSSSEHKNSALTGGGYFYNLRAPRFNGWLQGQLAFRLNRFIASFYILWGSNMALPAELWRAVHSDVCLRNDIHEDLDLAIHLHSRGYDVVYRENLRVGVYLKRLWSNREQQRQHLDRWPRTLKIHGIRLWWLGVVGNIFLIFIVQPIAIGAEVLSRLIGRRSKYNRPTD